MLAGGLGMTKRKATVARAPSMTKRKATVARAPSDLAAHEKELLFIDAIKAKLLRQSVNQRTSLTKFWGLVPNEEPRRDRRELHRPSVLKKVRRKLKHYTEPFAAAVDQLRARVRNRAAMKRPVACPRLVPPTEAQRSERRARQAEAIAAHRAQPPPVDVRHGDCVAVVYDDAAIYLGLVASVENDRATVEFNNGDADRDVGFDELRLVVAGHGGAPARARASVPEGDAGAPRRAAGSADVREYLEGVMRLADEEAAVEDIETLPASRIGGALAALEGGAFAAVNFDAAVAPGSRGRVKPCRSLPDPRLDPAQYDGFVWDLGCGSGPISEMAVTYAADAGIKVGAIRVDIDPRRAATLTMDVRDFDVREHYRLCPPFLVCMTCTCTPLSNLAHAYRSADASVASRARYQMTVGVLDHYVRMIELLKKLNPKIQIVLEFPKGRFDHEPVFARLQAAAAGSLRAVPYAHCMRYEAAWSKPGWLLTNIRRDLLPSDLLPCDGTCRSMKLVLEWTGRRAHCDHVFFDTAVAAATYLPPFAADVAIAALVTAFGA